MSDFNKPVRINFVGGNMVTVDAGSFEDRKTGETKEYGAALKINGIGKYPVRLEPELLNAIFKAAKEDMAFRAWANRNGVEV